MKPLVLIEAPSNLGLMPLRPPAEPGVRRMPDALRAAGLHDALKPSRIARVDAPHYDADENRTINIRNAQAIANYSRSLAAIIGDAITAGAFPFIIGGDCSILLGAMLALKRRGDPALLYVDAHSDFFVPEQSGTGGAAGMDLGLATGFGPELLTDIDGLKPYVQLNCVSLLGVRVDDGRPSPLIPPARKSGMDYRDLKRLRSDGIAESVEAAIDSICIDGAGGFWVHYDVDALDSRIMPAVDSPEPGGLSWAEAEELFGAALSNPRALGMQVTIFDPDLDPDGAIARKLSAHLLKILARRAM